MKDGTARGGLTPPRAAALRQQTSQDLCPTSIDRVPIHLQPSKKSFSLIKTGAATIPAIGSSIVVVSFRISAGLNAIINKIGNQLIGGGNYDGTGAFQWQLMINNSAARGLEQIISSIGTVSNPSEIGGFVRAKEAQLVSLVFTNVSVPTAGEVLQGRVNGWFYPKDEEQQGVWYD